ncbi:Crp/Fnr family transcriptional regulator [Natronospora cellulosivora (SeqCode)]
MGSLEDISFFKKSILFSELDKKQLIELSKLLLNKTYPANQTLFFQGDPGDNVFFLKRGKVKAIKRNADGEEQILDIFQRGDVFGEVVLFGIKHYPASAITMEEVELASLSKEKFRKYFYKNPDLGWGMLQEMAKKLKQAQNKIENLGLRDTKGRVATLLIDLLYKFGDEEKKSVLELNRQEMANFIGTTRETVSRTLSDFKKEGLVKINGNKIYIKDIEGLKKKF